MNRKLKEIRKCLKIAQEGLVRVKAWEFWQEELEKAKTYPPIKCSSCNAFLEEKDYIPNPETDVNSCRFCGNLV